MDERKLLVLGASGGCGRHVIRIAVERGHDVRAVVRPETAFDPPPGVEVRRASVLDEGVIDTAVRDREAVISCLGIQRKHPLNPWSRLVSPSDLTARTAALLCAAMRRHGVSRVAAISAAGVGDSVARTTPLIGQMIRRTNLRLAYRDLDAMEAEYASSGLDWMVVRPVTLVNGAATTRAREVARYGLMSRIARADVATWLVDAIEAPPPFERRAVMIGREALRRGPA